MLFFSCAKLTPLQSRFLASLTSLILLGLIYFALSNPHSAYAAELEQNVDGDMRTHGEDHNWHRTQDEQLLEDGIDLEIDEMDTEGKAKTTGLSSRQASTNIEGNNTPNYREIKAGNTEYWTYPRSLLQQSKAQNGTGLPGPIAARRDVQPQIQHVELRKRRVVEEVLEDIEEDQDESTDLQRRQNSDKQVFISINTCTQPTWQGSGPQTVPPPQLTLYVSTSNQQPGPGRGSNHTLVEGFANATVNATDQVYVSVVAPNLPNNFQGSWTYELAVSLNDYYHHVEGGAQFLFPIDTDTHGALLVTQNLTTDSPDSETYQKWMNFTPPPFTLFALKQDNTSYLGLGNSFCGLKSVTTIQGDPTAEASESNPVQMGMITRGLGNHPKQQFYMAGLDAATEYYGWAVMIGNGTDSGTGVVGGGGTVWPTNVPWVTKSDGNCQLLFNLTFCDQVAYAAPTNPDTFSADNIEVLRSLYDGYAAEMYKGFNYSLQQVPCNTSSDAQYSLAKTCTDCAAAYKEWLCAVTIPRCEDFSRNETWLQPRNMGQAFYNGTSLPEELLDSPYVPMQDAPTLPGSNAFSQTFRSSNATYWSRNPSVIIDQVKPGPYREVKPCRDLCYGLVQACPATMGFGCPLKGRGLEIDYGTREGIANGNITCSFLGAVYQLGGVGHVMPNMMMMIFTAGFTIFVTALLR